MGLFRRIKNNKKPVLRQIIDLVPRWMLDSCTKQFKTDKGCSKYRTYDQFVALTFGQLNKCYSLSDISTGIGVCETFIGDLGLTQSPARSTMSDGNKKRNWRVYGTLYNKLLKHYDRLLKQDNHRTIIEEIKDHSIKLIDSTLISLCLSMFDWAIPIAIGTDSKRRFENTHLLGWCFADTGLGKYYRNQNTRQAWFRANHFCQDHHNC